MKLPIGQTEQPQETATAQNSNILAPKREKIIKDILVGFAYSAIAFLLGYFTLPFGAKPFGIALLCATNKKTPYILGGLCISAILSEDSLILFSAYIAVTLIRLLVRLTLDTPWEEKNDSGEIEIMQVLPTLFRENLFLRMATSCVGVFILGLYSLIKGGFLYYDLFGAILSMLTAPIGVFLLYGIFAEKELPKHYEYLSIAALGAAVILSSKNLDIYGISLSAFEAMLATLYVCRKKGLLFGMGAGAICGLAYSPLFAPSFFLAALAAGALWRVSVIFASSAAFALAMAWGIYIGGISSLTSLMPALLAASLLFAVLDKTFLQKEIPAEADEVQDTKECESALYPCDIASDELLSLRLDASIARQRMLSDSFLTMSRFFSDLGEKMKRPLAYDTKNICDSAFDACCANCRCNAVCWEERHTETMAAVTALSAALHREGRISDNAIPESLRSVCERLHDITDEINHNYSLHTRQLLLCDKTEIFALDYKAMSELLSANTDLDGTEFTFNEELSKEVCELLSKDDMGIKAAVVFGNKRKRILLSANSEDKLKQNKLTLLSRLEEIWDSELEIESIKQQVNGHATITFAQKKRLSAEVAQKSASSRYEKNFCGDTSAIFENDDGMLYSIISDGMGSGRDAALTSGICVMFMKKMLSVASGCDSALKMLNGFLRNKGSGSIHECSATADIMELDLLCGKATFYKSGAAPSYVLRDGNLFKLRSNTVPLGIIRELDAKKISFEIQEGDVIVMVSDGITQGREDCPWLYELLKKNLGTRSLKNCAELMVERAKRENENDDISVMLIKVTRN